MEINELKIIELASVLAGPAVGMFFAEMGAEVLKIENKKTGGDVTRSWRLPEEKTKNVSAYFSSINYGKKHYFKDYTDAEDYQFIINHLKTADIVLCNFKAGTAEKFNLDYTTLKQFNPKLIYAQLNGFKSRPERVAFDVVLQAETGYMYMNGQPDSSPTKMPLALMDILAAHQLKEGILVALLQRQKTGKGAYVSTSLEEAAISSLANQATNWLMVHKIPQRIGSHHPNIAPYGDVFITQDNKELVLAIGSDIQFKKFCKLIDKEHLAEDKRFSTNKNRVTNRNELQEYLAKGIKRYKLNYLIEQCIKLGIPMGGIKNMKEVFENLVAQEMILEETIKGEHTKRVKTVAFKIEE